MSKLLIALVISLASSQTYAVGTFIRNLECQAANGVTIRTVTPAVDLAYAKVDAQFGWIHRIFRATVTNGLNGTTLIELKDNVGSYQIAVNVDQRSALPQTVSGNLVRPNPMGLRFSPVFISKIRCDVLFL